MDSRRSAADGGRHVSVASAFVATLLFSDTSPLYAVSALLAGQPRRMRPVLAEGERRAIPRAGWKRSPRQRCRWRSRQARASSELFGYLDAPVERVAARDTWVGYNPELEDAILPQTSWIADAAERLLRY
jgi:hypothetical protein